MALAPAVIFQGWANVIRTEYLIPEKKDGVYVKSAWLGAIVNLVMNIMLIPYYGAVGAAIGTICAEAAVAIYQSIYAAKEIPVIGYLKKIWQYFIPAVAMWFAVQAVGKLFVENNIAKILAEFVVGAATYCLISFPYLIRRYKALRGIERNETE